MQPNYVPNLENSSEPLSLATTDFSYQSVFVGGGDVR